MTFYEARTYFGIDGIPDCLAPYYEEMPAAPLLDRVWLTAELERYGVDAQKSAALYAALDALEADAALCSFAHFLVKQTCVRHIRADEDYIDLGPCAAMGTVHGAYFPLLVMLACVRPATAAYRARGIDDAVFIPTVERMLSSVLRRYARSGDPHVNFEWESGLFTCALLQFGRFYFAPHRYDDGITILKNRTTSP